MIRYTAATLLALLILTALGCQNHRRHLPIIIDDTRIVGDVNSDGVVDEADLDLLRELLDDEPDISDPFPPPPEYPGCDVSGDGFFTYEDEAQLVEILILIRAEIDAGPIFEDDDDDDDDDDHPY